MKHCDEIMLVARMAIKHYRMGLRVAQIEYFAKKLGTRIKHGTYYSAMAKGEEQGYFTSQKVGKERYYKNTPKGEELE